MIDCVNSLMQKARFGRVNLRPMFHGTKRKRTGKVVHAVIVLIIFCVLPGVLYAEQAGGYLDISGGYKTGDLGCKVVLTCNILFLTRLSY